MYYQFLKVSKIRLVNPAQDLFFTKKLSSYLVKFEEAKNKKITEKIITKKILTFEKYNTFKKSNIIF